MSQIQTKITFQTLPNVSKSLATGNPCDHGSQTTHGAVSEAPPFPNLQRTKMHGNAQYIRPEIQFMGSSQQCLETTLPLHVNINVVRRVLSGGNGGTCPVPSSFLDGQKFHRPADHR